MARFTLSFLAIFVLLAALAMSLPTKSEDLTPDQKMGLDNALDDLKSATKMMNGLDNKDTNNQDDDFKTDPSSSQNSAEEAKDDAEEKKVKNNKNKQDENKPTKTSKKPTSGNFASPTATKTSKPSSQANALGKIPIIGGLLGGTGSGL